MPFGCYCAAEVRAIPFDACHLVFPHGTHWPHGTPSVIASVARQSRRRSQAGAPTNVHPSHLPPCHCERSAAIPQPKQSRRVDGCSQSSRFPLVLSLSKDSRNDRLKWVHVTNIPSLSRRQSLATIKTVGYKNRRLKKKTRTPHPTPIPPPRRRERARARAQCPQHQHSHTNKAHQ